MCGDCVQGHAASQDGQTGRLAGQVSSLSEQLHAAHAATAAAQQEVHHLRHRQQVHACPSRTTIFTPKKAQTQN